MEGMDVALQELVELLVGGVTTLGSGIASGVNSFVDELFFVTNEGGAITGLTTTAGAVGIFGGVALAVGLTSLVFAWIRSLGN